MYTQMLKYIYKFIQYLRKLSRLKPQTNYTTDLFMTYDSIMRTEGLVIIILRNLHKERERKKQQQEKCRAATDRRVQCALRNSKSIILFYDLLPL